MNEAAGRGKPEGAVGSAGPGGLGKTVTLDGAHAIVLVIGDNRELLAGAGKDPLDGSRFEFENTARRADPEPTFGVFEDPVQ